MNILSTSRRLALHLVATAALLAGTGTAWAHGNATHGA
jgi:hypothetical protein